MYEVGELPRTRAVHTRVAFLLSGLITSISPFTFGVASPLS